MRPRLVALVFASVLAVAGWSALPAGGDLVSGSVPDAPLGTDPATVSPARVRGAYELGDGVWAMPMRAAKPSWLTPEIELAAREGKGRPQPAPDGAPPIPGPPVDAPGSGFIGIRPGSWMVSPAGCTMNFVFGSPGNYSIGTAGHCIQQGQDVILLTLAPPNQDPCVPLSDICIESGTPVLVNIGTATKSVDGGVGNDFAVIPVRPELQSWVYPTIAQVGGPCGSYTADGTLPDITVPFIRGVAPVEAGEGVFHYGHGAAIGTGGTPRAGVATGWTSDAYVWVSPSMLGDSGSAVRIHDLKAAGDLTHLIIDLRTGVGVVAGTRISKMEQIAGKPLADSPYCV